LHANTKIMALFPKITKIERISVTDAFIRYDKSDILFAGQLPFDVVFVLLLPSMTLFCRFFD